MSLEHAPSVEDQESNLEKEHIGWVENTLDSVKHVGKQVVGIGVFYAILEGLKAHGVIDIDSQAAEAFLASAAGIISVNLMTRKKNNQST